MLIDSLQGFLQDRPHYRRVASPVAQNQVRQNPATQMWRTIPIPMSCRTKLADLVWLLHSGIVGFFTLGWALPWRTVLWSILIGAFAMRLHWYLNDDVCVLTALERRLRGSSPRPADSGESFITSLGWAVLRRPLSPRWVQLATHGVLWLSAGVAGVRLISM